MFDLVVIGGGLAGVIAALTARKNGARVALSSRSWGETALSNGGFDIAYSPALSPIMQMPRTVAEHIMDIIAHRPHHPYGVLGLENTINGIANGYNLLVHELKRQGLTIGPLIFENENVLLPSSLGALQPVATAQHAQLGLEGFRSLTGRWGIASFNGMSYFNAERIAEGLRYDVLKATDYNIDINVINVDYDANKPPMLLAKELDDKTNATNLAQVIEQAAKSYDGVLVPPVLGLEHHSAIYTHICKIVDLPVVETLAHLPSVPGVRLQHALDAALLANEIKVFNETTNMIIDNKKVVAITTKANTKLQAKAFVLASGRFIAGGVSFNKRAYENIFNLPLSSELGPLETDSPLSVVRETLIESHPLFTAGVLVDHNLQPLCEGEIAFDNLYAAGMVICGYASRYTLCADGIALCTGVIAAEKALS